MNKTLPFFLLLSTLLFGEMPIIDFAQNQQIAVQNTILAKVNGNTISVIDVKKKMDLLLHQHYPQLIQSNQARLQFYETSWRRVLMDMIDHELILADAADKEIKLTDGEVREEMERRFSPNVTQTLDKIGLSYDEAWKLLKNELIVQRMSWWFIHSKAAAQVTPQSIRQQYRLHLAENPAYTEWKYRVISLRTQDKTLVEKIYAFLIEKQESPEFLQNELKELDPSVQISTEYSLPDKGLSESHKAALASLSSPGTYGTPLRQTSRTDKNGVYRIFYLIEKEERPARSFEEMAPEIKNALNQQAIVQESNFYLEKLRNTYGFDAAYQKELLPEDLHPFSLR